MKMRFCLAKNMNEIEKDQQLAELYAENMRLKIALQEKEQWTFRCSHCMQVLHDESVPCDCAS